MHQLLIRRAVMARRAGPYRKFVSVASGDRARAREGAFLVVVAVMRLGSAERSHPAGRPAEHRGDMP